MHFPCQCIAFVAHALNSQCGIIGIHVEAQWEIAVHKAHFACINEASFDFLERIRVERGAVRTLVVGELDDLDIQTAIGRHDTDDIENFRVWAGGYTHANGLGDSGGRQTEGYSEDGAGKAESWKRH